LDGDRSRRIQDRSLRLVNGDGLLTSGALSSDRISSGENTDDIRWASRVGSVGVGYWNVSNTTVFGVSPSGVADVNVTKTVNSYVRWAIQERNCVIEINGLCAISAVTAPIANDPISGKSISVTPNGVNVGCRVRITAIVFSISCSGDGNVSLCETFNFNGRRYIDDRRGGIFDGDGLGIVGLVSTSIINGVCAYPLKIFTVSQRFRRIRSPCDGRVVLTVHNAGRMWDE